MSFAESLKYALDNEYKGKKNYYEWLNDLYAQKKEEVLKIFRNAPFEYRVLDPEGGYFVIIDITKAIPKIPKKYFFKESEDTQPIGDLNSIENPDYSADYAFTRWLTFEYGVTPVPMFAFYNQDHAKNKKEYKGSNFVRIAICKSDETLNAVADRLKKN